MSGRPKQKWATLSDIGRMRSHNEDSILAQPPLFAVADGLGGHEAGEVASSIAVQTLLDNAPRRADANALARAVRAANKEVLRAAKEGVGRSGMGTTITAAIIERGSIAIAHVGDSRAYLLHDGELRQLTEDHSMVADLIRKGQLTPEEARVHPNRSVITRALGTDPNMVADTYVVDAHAGDRLLLCSDGLTGMLVDERIGELLGGYSEPATAARMLVDAANEAGGHDNISVIVVDIDTTSNAATGVREGDRSTRAWLAALLWIAAVAVVVAGIGYGTYTYARSKAFVISSGDTVVVYQGVPGQIAGISLSWPVETVTADVTALSPGQQQRLRDGVTFDDLATAQAFAQSIATTTGP